MTLTPQEIRTAAIRRDANLDCTPAELEGRRAQREADRRWRESVRRHHRFMDLLPASKAVMESRAQATLDADAEAQYDRNQCEQAALRDAAQAEWEAFGGQCTQQQMDAWKEKFARFHIAFTKRLNPVNIVPLPKPETYGVPPLGLTFYADCATRAPKKHIHKGVFAMGENSSTFGAPGSIKSGLLTDIAVHAAAGLDWRGYKCKRKCGVVLFAFERADQAKRRLAAYEKRDGLKTLPIAVCGTIIDMLNPSCVDVVVATVRAAEKQFGIPAGLLVFDTISKAIAAGGGDEDKARDQNIMAANMRRIHERLGDVHIAGVGHSGKDESRGERGSNARLGDVDLQIQVTGDTIKTATITKANDGPEGQLTCFAGELVTVGMDEDGDPETAFILSPRIVNPPAQGKGTKLSDRQALALRALEDAIRSLGESVKGIRAVTPENWKDEMFRRGVLSEESANPRADYQRLRDALARKAKIVEVDGFIHLRTTAALTPVPPPPSPLGK